METLDTTAYTPTQVKSTSKQQDLRKNEQYAKDEVISQLSQTRQSISLMTKSLGKGEGEAALKLAFMWLGKAKSALRSSTAAIYPEAYATEDKRDPADKTDKEKAAESPKADESIDELEIPKELDEEGKAKFTKDEYGKILTRVRQLVGLLKDFVDYQLAVTNAQSKLVEASLYVDEAHAEIAAKKAEEGKDKKKKPERKPVKLSSVVPTAADQQLIKDAEAEAEAEAEGKSGKDKKAAEERKVTAPTARR